MTQEALVEKGRQPDHSESTPNHIERILAKRFLTDF